MEREILRERLTHNVKQLKKYIDEAILKGAETIRFVGFDSENPYFVFESDFTPEEEREYELANLKNNFEQKKERLESQNYKTHFFRKERYGLCGKEVEDLIEKFKASNNIIDSLRPKIKQVITDEYDDFDENKETVFITEILENK